MNHFLMTEIKVQRDHKLTTIFLALLTFFILQGCSIMKIHVPFMASVQGIPGHFKIGQIIDLEKGKALSFEQLIDQIASKDLIFIGEVHDNPEHHLIQVQILQALVLRCGPMDIAMEFFQKPQQPFLDRYLKGEITESDFLKEADWEKGWGFDYHYYRPLMLLAKQNGTRILAINAPRQIVKKVARSGLKSLDELERNQLPENIDLSNKAHRAYVHRAFKEHGHGDLKDFDYFYEAQCVWEDTMAHNLAEYFRRDHGKLIVFAGNGHIIHKFGIPLRTANRAPVSMVTIMPYPINPKMPIKKEAADYVWLTSSYPHRHGMF